MTDQEIIDTLKRHNRMRADRMAVYFAIMVWHIVQMVRHSAFTRDNAMLVILWALLCTFTFENFLRIRRRIQHMQQNNEQER